MRRDQAADIRITRGFDGVAVARGHVVVIDVLRAFTTLAHVFDAGAVRAILVATPEEALARRAREPDLVLVGEVRGRPIPGFDAGNSPDAVRALDLAEKTIVFRSSNGVAGAVQAARADSLLLASLVVAQATVDRLLRVSPPLVTLCPMGSSSGKDGVEDDACADLLAARLAGDDLDLDEIVRRVRESGGGKAALDPTVTHVTPQDLAHATEIDRFPFAMMAVREGEDLVARPVAPQSDA